MYFVLLEKKCCVHINRNVAQDKKEPDNWK